MRADIVGISLAAVAAVVTKNIFLGPLYYVYKSLFAFHSIDTHKCKLI